MNFDLIRNFDEAYAKWGHEKGRCWSFLVYPDSAPEDWLHIIWDLMLPMAISPLHDKDNKLDGSLVKPHYHVMWYRKGPITFENAWSIAQQFNSPYPIKIEYPKNYFKYYTHEKRSDKALYSANDILTLGGFSINDAVSYTESEIQDGLLIINGLVSQYRAHCERMKLAPDYQDLQNFIFARSDSFEDSFLIRKLLVDKFNYISKIARI